MKFYLNTTGTSGSCVSQSAYQTASLIPLPAEFNFKPLPAQIGGAPVIVCAREFAVTPWDDATWVLTSAFIIFTMQSGFGLLESGSVSPINEANIMVKNAVDVLFGGVSYWMLGYGLSFDRIDSSNDSTNAFVGTGEFFVDEIEPGKAGDLFSHFFFQASFATTSTTIVSGAMAERTKLETYILFSFFNTFIYCFPSHWLWDGSGWLKGLGVIDIAGAGAVHLVGGVTGLVATLMLKPRSGRFDEGVDQPALGSPTNAIFGLFMLWWGWLGFNCGSTFGLTEHKWVLASRSAVSTVTASIGGGVTAILISYLTKRRKFEVYYLINGILGSLVSITALCAVAQPFEGLLIGIVGAVISCSGGGLLERFKIDDPVNVVPVHAMSGCWSLVAVGIFARKDIYSHSVIFHNGLLAGGGCYLLGVQCLAVFSITAWTAITSFVILKILDLTVGLRVPLHEELLGADLVEHSIRGTYDKVSREWRNESGVLIMVVQELKEGDEQRRDACRIRRVSRECSDRSTKSFFGFTRKGSALPSSDK